MIESVTFSVLYLLIFFFLSVTLRFPKSTPLIRQRKIASSCLTLVYSSILVLLACYSYYSTSGISYTAPISNFEYLLICVSYIQNTSGYFFHEIIMGTILGYLETKYLIHHSFGLIGGFAAIANQTGGPAIIGKL